MQRIWALYDHFWLTSQFVIQLISRPSCSMYIFVKYDDTIKSNQIVTFIHHLQVFISIQLLIKVAWDHLFGVALISLLIKVCEKWQNYFTKICSQVLWSTFFLCSANRSFRKIALHLWITILFQFNDCFLFYTPFVLHLHFRHIYRVHN